MPGSTTHTPARGKTVMVCVDVHPETSEKAVRFTMREVVTAGDTVRIVTVLPLGGEAISDDPRDSAYGWSGQAWKKERQRGADAAMKAVKDAMDLVASYDVSL